MRTASVLALALLLAACPKAKTVPPERGLARKAGVVDSHVHAGPKQEDALLKLMDEQGLAWVVNLSGTWPGALLEQQLEIAHRTGRMVVAANLPWRAAGRTTEFPQLAVELIRESHRLGARALKIEKALGLAVIKPDGSLLAVDDPWLDPIWNVAGELGLPVVIHTGDPKAFWLPVNEANERWEELNAHPGWSNYGLPIPSFDALLAQLMRAVARHPKTQFVAVHFGNNSEDPFWVGRMLDEHPNLHVDLAARLPELGRHDPDKLRALFIKHADRILFGTDTGLGSKGFLMLGSYGEEPNRPEEIGPYFQAHWRWLETRDDMPSPTPIQGRWTLHGLGLPEDVLAKIYRTNAERLFGRPEIVKTSTVAAPPR